MRSLAEWIELQQRVHPRAIDLGLERVARIARALGVERPDAPTWIVGGTNGKGSTIAYLHSILAAAQFTTGVFTSPHLVRYNERVRVGGAEVPDAELIEAFEAIEAARGATTLTFFEFSALAALLVFRWRGVDAQLLEVGLGGRLDATNLVDADVAVLCSVGSDHHQWLGPTLEDVGREKAGIFRHGRPAIIGAADLPASVFTEVERIGAVPHVARRDYDWEHSGERWTYRSRARTLADLPIPALVGEVQFANAAAAIAALDAGPLPVSAHAVARGLEQARLPGRFQVVPGEVEWILDVAHNAPAAAELARNLAARAVRGRTLALAGFLDDKDVAAIGRVLAPHIDAWVIASLPPPRGLTAAQVAGELGIGAPLAQCESMADACAQARAATRPGDRIVAFGSFHLVGPVLEWLQLY